MGTFKRRPKSEVLPNPWITIHIERSWQGFSFHRFPARLGMGDYRILFMWFDIAFFKRP